jgi:hypothetical protein
MDYKELQDILSTLEYTSYKLEETYVENEGEVTEETELMEGEISAMKTLLNTEGVDLLGRWLKGKEDRKKALKAEKDYLTRQMEAIDKTIEFIKTKMNEVMTATGQEKIKGSLGYSFATYNSVKTDVDKDLLRFKYDFKAEQALRAAGIPEYIGFSLTASTTKAKEIGVLDDDDKIFVTTETPTIRFTKPRAKKED